MTPGHMILYNTNTFSFARILSLLMQNNNNNNNNNNNSCYVAYTLTNIDTNYKTIIIYFTRFLRTKIRYIFGCSTSTCISAIYLVLTY